MKVLIQGGGISGLALAALLKRKGIVPVLVERAPAFKTIGYAIALWEGGQEVLRDLGCLDDLMRKGNPVHEGSVTDPHGEVMLPFDFDAMCAGHRVPVVVRRSEGHEVLIEAARGVDLRLGTTVRALYLHEGYVDVELSDGTREKFDLVVAADGMRSDLRERVFGEGLLRYYGWSYIVAWIDGRKAARRDLLPEGMRYIVRRDESMLIIPVGGDMFVAAFFIHRPYAPPDAPEERLAEVRTLFADFGPVVDAVVRSIDPAQGLFFDNLCRVEMNDWYRGRVVLMGDARHGMPPHTGLGAMLALEDARVLAEELFLADKGRSIEEALRNYASRRTPRVRYVQALSRTLFRVLFVHAKIPAFLRDPVLRIVPRRMIMGMIFRRILKHKI